MMRWRFVWGLIMVCILAWASSGAAGTLFKRDSGRVDPTAGFSGPPGYMAGIRFDSATDPVFAQANKVTIQAVRVFLTGTDSSDTLRVRILRQAGSSDTDATRPTSAFSDLSRAVAARLTVPRPTPGTQFPTFTDWVVFKTGSGEQDVEITDNQFFVVIELVRADHTNLGFDVTSPLDQSWFFDTDQWRDFSRTMVFGPPDFTSAAFPGGIMIQAISGIKGDVNGNGSVNLGDGGRVLDFILGVNPQPSEFERFEADFNNDGSPPNLGDVIKIIDTVLHR